MSASVEAESGAESRMDQLIPISNFKKIFIRQIHYLRKQTAQTKDHDGYERT